MCTSIYLINRLPTKSFNDISRYEILFNKLSSYDTLRVFGTQRFPCLRAYCQNKLQARLLECVFVGFAANHRGYLCLHVSASIVYISRHVIFNDHVFPFSSMSLSIASSNLFTFPISCSIPFASTNSSTSPSLPEHNLVPIYFSTEPSCAPISSFIASTAQPCPINHHPMVIRAKTGISKLKVLYAAYVTILPVLKNWKTAIALLEWKASMHQEYNALILNDT